MSTMLKRLLAAASALVLLFALWGCGSTSSPPDSPSPGNPNPAPNPSPTPSPSPTPGAVSVKTEVVADGLQVPWEIVFASDGRIFFTEQPGRLRVIQNGSLVAQAALDLTSIVPGGEAGMLGLEIDRGFDANGFLYVFYCYKTSKYPSGVGCRVSRLIMSGNSAREDKVLLDIPGTNVHHNAGRIKIGPDGFLYVAAGDTFVDQLAQDPASPNGKILRITLDGSPAPGNPFPQNPLVYTVGHRDPQGLAFDSSGALYGTEHGPISNDEVNLLQIGKNYGWPICVGICHNPLYEDPIKLFSPETAAPSGATFYNSNVIPQWNGSLLFACLGLNNNTFAHHVHRIKFDKPGGTTIVEEEALFKDQFGRIRTVAQSPEGFVYFSTGNGTNDKIVRVRPQ